MSGRLDFKGGLPFFSGRSFQVRASSAIVMVFSFSSYFSMHVPYSIKVVNGSKSGPWLFLVFLRYRPMSQAVDGKYPLIVGLRL
jgi:hypothetical protein